MKALIGLLVIMLAASTVFAEDYVIGDGDVLQISVWGEPALSGSVTVRPDGKITLPAAGDVLAAGETPVQLGGKLTKVLKKFVKKPIVTVSVTGITNNKVYVAGGGVPSSVVNLPGKTTLFQFLCSLGSLENADLRHAYLMRNAKKLDVDFHDLLVDGDFAKNPVLQSGDDIFIPNKELDKVYVLGAVKTPKFIYYRDGMRVLDAILEADGFNDYAKKNDVTIIRKNGTRIHVKLKDIIEGKDTAYNIFLKPGDYITIEEGLF